MIDHLPPDFYRAQPATISCVVQAAARHEVPANVLLAIASVEGGRNGQWVRNRNGSYDLGHMQINTTHLAQWARWGIRAEDIAQRGCYNAELAAWLLARHLNRATPADFWTRAANYHSQTPQHNRAYRAKLIPYAAAWGHWLRAQRAWQVSER